MTISADSHRIVLRAASKCAWTCADWNVQRMLMQEGMRRLKILQEMGEVDSRAHLSRRIERKSQ